jgi:hypothetical protein
MSDRGQLAAGLLLLTAVIAGYYWPWLSMRTAFFQVDIAFMDHPIRYHAAQMVRSGHFPFWTPDLLGGFPLFAEGQAAILYPGTWLYLFLPPEMALNWLVVSHYVLMGGATYVFLRARPLVPPAAMLGALAFSFSSFALVEHVLPCFLTTIAWLPLLLWLLERSLTAPSARARVGASVVVALMHLAGDPLGALLSLLLAAAYVAFGTEAPTGLRTRITAIVVPVGLGTLLAAVQLVPTFEFLGESTRDGAGPSWASANFLATPLLLTALYPRFFGDSFAGYAGPDPPGWEEGLFVFIGWAPLLLAVFGAAAHRPRRFWLAALGASLLLGVRCFLPLSQLAWSLPPLALFRWPARVFLWYALALSVLAAYGLDALWRRELSPDGLRRRVIAALAAVLIGLALFGAFHAQVPDRPLSETAVADLIRLRGWDAVLFVVNWSGLLALVVLFHRGAVPRPVLLGGLAASLACGVGVSPRPMGVPPRLYSEAPEAARFLATRPPGARFLSPVGWGQPNRPTDAAGLASSMAYLPANLHLRHGLRAVGQFDLAATTTLRRNREALVAPAPSVLDLLAVDAIAVPRERRGAPAPSEADLTAAGYERCFTGAAEVYCRRGHGTRARLVRRHQVLPGDGVFAALRTADLREVVFVDREPAWPQAGGPPSEGTEAVNIIVDEPSRVALDATARDSALLVLADTAYPGWRAEVDGVAAEILTANGFVRAVAVPAGRHRVTFHYDPAPFRAGAAASLTGLLAAGLALFAERRRAAATTAFSG